MVAKVEWHKDELFPRIGFIVTNLGGRAARVTRFYNGRGTAEQCIKEGKSNWEIPVQGTDAGLTVQNPCYDKAKWRATSATNRGAIGNGRRRGRGEVNGEDGANCTGKNLRVK